MYEIYINNRIAVVDGNKLPNIAAVSTKIKNEILVYSDTSPSSANKITEGTLTFTDNAAGSLEITLPPCNDAYNDLTPLLSEVIVNRDGKPIWYGRLLTVDEDFWKNKKCVFEGELSYLLDSLQTPQKYVMNNEDNNTASFIRRWLSQVIAKHNGAVEDYKRFTLGSTPSESDLDSFLGGTEQIEVTTNFENTLDVIKSNLLDIGLNVHVSISHDSFGKRIIDFKSGYTAHNESMQSINFGKNMLDYACNVDGSVYYTVIYPRGKKIDHQIDDDNAEYVPTIDTYVHDGIKYYEKVLDYSNPNADDNSKKRKDTYRYKAVSTKDDDVPYAKGWFVRYDYYRSTDREVVISDLKTYYTKKTDTRYSYEPVEIESLDSPVENGWYEREINLNIIGGDSLQSCYEYRKTKDKKVEYGKWYYKANSIELEKEFRNMIDNLPISELTNPKSKYLCDIYVGRYCRIADSYTTTGATHIEPPYAGTYIRAGEYFKIERRWHSQQGQFVYIYHYIGNEESDFLNEQVFSEVTPRFDSKKYNPAKNEWYTIQATGNNVGDLIDGRSNPNDIRNSYRKSGSSVIHYPQPYFQKFKEKIINFYPVTSPEKENSKDPFVNKWYELITDTNASECVSLVGSKTGMKSGDKLYIDGQTGKMYNLAGIKAFGYIYNVVDFDDADTPTKLLHKSLRYFRNFDYNQMTFEISALDLHLLNPNIKSFELLENIYCQSEPHGLNTDSNNILYFPVTEIAIDLLNPENTKYTLNGNTARSISKSASSSDKNFNKYVDDVKVVSENSILEAARRHADEIIKKSIDGSYAGFVYQYDQNLIATNSAYKKMTDSYKPVPVSADNPSLGDRALGFRVANGPTDDQSTGKGEWFAGGLGYYNRPNTKSNWNPPKVAITMDGHIVCDFIDTGTLRLSGSTRDTSSRSTTGSEKTSTYLEVWASDPVFDKNKKLIGRKEVQIGSWNEKGINITRGSIAIGLHYEKNPDGTLYTVPNFWVDADGCVYAHEGVITGTLIGTEVDPVTIQAKGSFNGSGSLDGTLTGTAKDITLEGSINGNNNATIKNVILDGISEARFSKADIDSGSISGVFKGSVYIGEIKNWDYKTYPNGTGYYTVIDKDGNMKIGYNKSIKDWNFYVSRDGVLTANSGVFRGTVSGGIVQGGRLRIGKNDFSDELTDAFGSSNSNSKKNKDWNNWIESIKKDPNNRENYNFYVGNEGDLYIGPPAYKGAGWNFRVTNKGHLYAKKGTFSGTVEGATIQGCTIKGGAIQQSAEYTEGKGKNKKKKVYQVLIADGRIKTQGTFIKICESLNNEDKENLALGHDYCAYEKDGKLKMVESKWLIQAAIECKQRNGG